MKANETTHDQFTHQFVPAQDAQQDITLLLLHGTGGNEYDLLDLGRMLLPGAALLSPRGKVLEHGMPRFFRRLAEGVFDEEDLRYRTDELAQFVQSASQHYGFSAQKVVAAGFSNGANIAASMLLLRPEVLSGGLLFHPMVPLTPEQLPDLAGKAVFIGAGRNDPIVPTTNTERLVQMLQQSGADVSAHWFSSGHSLGIEEVRAARTWVQTNLR